MTLKRSIVVPGAYLLTWGCAGAQCNNHIPNCRRPSLAILRPGDFQLQPLLVPPSEAVDVKAAHPSEVILQRAEPPKARLCRFRNGRQDFIIYSFRDTILKCTLSPIGWTSHLVFQISSNCLQKKFSIAFDIPFYSAFAVGIFLTTASHQLSDPFPHLKHNHHCSVGPEGTFEPCPQMCLLWSSDPLYGPRRDRAITRPTKLVRLDWFAVFIHRLLKPDGNGTWCVYIKYTEETKAR